MHPAHSVPAPGEVPKPQTQNATLPICLAAIVLFAIAASLTVYYARAMAGGMKMPGGWTMSMMWMMGHGPLAALAFIGVWAIMMVAMMLPSTLPMLLLYRRVILFRGEGAAGGKIFLTGAGYFAVWAAFGAAAYFAGTAVTRAAMVSVRISHLVPLATGVALMIAAAYQLTPVKSTCLRHCRDPLSFAAGHFSAGWRGALNLGIHHGAFCAACCWGLMLIQLALGVMSLPVMTAVAVLIALEKLAPRGELLAKVIGTAAMAAGIVLVIRAVH
jgi:predicted metal-binding membrane protein